MEGDIVDSIMVLEGRTYISLALLAIEKGLFASIVCKEEAVVHQRRGFSHCLYLKRFSTMEANLA